MPAAAHGSAEWWAAESPLCFPISSSSRSPIRSMRRTPRHSGTYCGLGFTRPVMSRRHAGSRYSVFGTVRSKPLALLIVVGGLALSGALLGRVAAPVWTAAREKQPALRLDSSMVGAGQGVTLALL